MRGKLLIQMREAKNKPVVTLEEYTTFVRSYQEVLGLTSLQVKIISGMMFEEKLPLFEHFLLGIVYPKVILRNAKLNELS